MPNASSSSGSVAMQAATNAEAIRDAQQKRAAAGETLIAAAAQNIGPSNQTAQAVATVDTQTARVAALKQKQAALLNDFTQRVRKEASAPKRPPASSAASQYRAGLGTAALSASALQMYEERRRQPTALDLLSETSPFSRQLRKEADENRRGQRDAVLVLSRLLPPLQQRAQEHIAESRKRSATLKQIKRGSAVGAAGTIAVIAMVFLAILADILSIIDIQWLISWAIPLVSAYVIYRTRAISTFLNSISSEPLRAMVSRKSLIEKRAAAMARSPGAQPPPTFTITRSLYPSPTFWNFIIESLLVQIVELIPVIGIIPTLTTQAIKNARALYAASGRGNSLVVAFRDASRNMDALEQWEISLYGTMIRRPLALLLLLQQQEDDLIRRAKPLEYADFLRDASLQLQRP